MKPEAQRIAIARTQNYSNFYQGKHDGWLVADLPGYEGGCCRVPDYLNDLNAMHSVEEWLSEQGEGDDAYNYDMKWLPEVTGAYDKETGLLNTWALIHATAAQRSEAFLRTLNLWTP